MSNKLIVGVVGLAISVIMVASVLMPIIADVNDNERAIINNSITNSNYSVFKTTESEETHIIEWTKGESYQYVDGGAVTVGSYNSYMIVSDKIAVYVSIAGNSYYDLFSGSLQFPSDFTEITITISGASVRLESDGTSAVDVTVDNVRWYALPDQNGTHKLHQSIGTGTIAINSIDQIYGVMRVSAGSLGFVSYVGNTATLEDGSTVEMMINATKDNAYVDLYTIPKVGGYFMDPDYLTNNDGTPISPYFMLVPNVVYAHTAQQADMLSIINVIPLMMVLAIAIAAVALIRSRY